MSKSCQYLWRYVEESGITAEKAMKDYQDHKKVCKMPYDPHRIPRQCPKCARLIEIWSIADLIESREVKA